MSEPISFFQMVHFGITIILAIAAIWVPIRAAQKVEKTKEHNDYQAQLNKLESDLKLEHQAMEIGRASCRERVSSPV